MRSMIGGAAALFLTACVVQTRSNGPGRPEYAPPDRPPPGERGGPVADGNRAPDPDAPFVGSPGKSRPGDRASMTQTNCDGAHDHCLPPDTIFATEWQGGKPDRAYVALKIETGLWAWERSDIVRGNVRGLATERATTQNLAPGALVVGFRMGEELGRVPASEAEAVAPYWQVGKVVSVDRGSKTFRVEGLEQPMAIVSARVVKNP